VLLAKFLGVLCAKLFVDVLQEVGRCVESGRLSGRSYRKKARPIVVECKSEFLINNEI
jgi:hypothetical protein